MAPKLLKRFLNRLKCKRVHEILEPLQNSTFVHRSFATFCDPFPATSTTINEGLRIQPNVDLSEHSFAFSGSLVFTDQSLGLFLLNLLISIFCLEVSGQAESILERSFQRYFGNVHAFSMKNIRCSVDAYNSWIKFKHSR
jgi:hypothetical protein